MSAELAKQAANLANSKKNGTNSDPERTNITDFPKDSSNDSDPTASAATCITSPTVSNLVSSLNQSLKGVLEDHEKPKSPFIRPRKKTASTRPFSSMAACAPQVLKMKGTLERRSFVGSLSSDSLGNKIVSQSRSNDLNDSRTTTSSSSSPSGMSSLSPSKLPTEEVTSPVKTNTTVNGRGATATMVATTEAVSQEPKSPQDSPCDSESGTSPSKSLNTAISTEVEQSPPPATPTPTSPSSKMAISNHPKRLRSSKCREVWTLPSKGSVFKQSTTKDIPTLGEELEETITLPQLVEDHWSKFPLRVRIMRGLLEEQLSNKSILDIHFLKRTKVVDICDSLNQRFLIPHNSPIRFGMVYCPGVKNENYYFDKVLDVIQAPDMPKVVTCTKKVKGKDEKSNLSANEVLIVIEVVKGLHSYSKLPRKPKLKVFSFTERKEKVLSGDMIGKFTTDPKKAQFYIPEILEYIPNPFPMSARLFLEDDYLPDILTKNPITMLSSTIEDSIIGNVKEEETQCGINKKDLTNLIELPVVPDILVSLIPEDQIQLNTIEILYEDTQATWRDFVSPSDKVPVCPRPAVSGRTSVQNKLSTLYRKGEEAKGSALEAPPLMKKDLSTIQGSSDLNAYQVLVDGVASVNQYMQPSRSFSSSNSSFDTTRSNSTTDDSDIGGRCIEGGHIDQDLEAFEKIMKSKRDMIREEPAELHSSNLRFIRRIEAVESRVATAAPQAIINRLTRRVEALESKSLQRVERKISQEERTEIDDLKLVVEAMHVSFKVLEDEVKDMKVQLTEVLDVTRRKKESQLHDETTADRQDNIAVLRSMDSNQILMLLDRLELNQYKEVFVEEAITGEILVECTETILIEDLDIKEPSHCSKLMDVVHGNPATRGLLDSIKTSLQ